MSKFIRIKDSLLPIVSIARIEREECRIYVTEHAKTRIFFRYSTNREAEEELVRILGELNG